ncbi:MAG: DUF5915 domain-containing protein, partial [Candidatus Eisenbacteria bacterium]
PDQVEIEEKGSGSFEMERSERALLFLDTALDENLLEEGFAREMVNKIQFMRKEAGFDVVDRVRVVYEGSDRLARAVERHSDQIRADTLSVCLARGEARGESVEEWDLNGEPARIAVSRASPAAAGRKESEGEQK